MARTYTLYNLQIVLALALGSFTYGYSFSVISNTLGQPGFLEYFNLIGKSANINGITGAINGLFCAGAAFGAINVGWLCEAKGRKTTLYVSCVVSIIGGALQTGSIHIAMFLVSRFIAGWGVGMMSVLIPVFQSEISPPNARGFLVGQHGTWIVVGYSLAGWVGVGSYYSTNQSFQWRFPIALTVLPPLILLMGSPKIPESPRWLLTRDRHEEARKIINRLHGDANGQDNLYAREEFYQMTQQVQADAVSWGQGKNKQLFTKPSYRKRMWMGFFVQVATQATGSQVIYVYVVGLYQTLGLTGGVPLILGAVYTTVAAIANFIGALIMDRLGRKPMLLIGLAGCMHFMSLETAMVASFAGTTNKAGLSMGIFFTYCFVTCYGCFIDVVSYVYCAEIFPTQIRPQGMAWSQMAGLLSTLIYTEAGPTALANIQWRYYIVFIALTALNLVILYVWCPETKGLSLEEINEKFGDEVVVHFANATETEKAELTRTVVAEEEEKHAATLGGPALNEKVSVSSAVSEHRENVARA